MSWLLMVKRRNGYITVHNPSDPAEFLEKNDWFGHEVIGWPLGEKIAEEDWRAVKSEMYRQFTAHCFQRVGTQFAPENYVDIFEFLDILAGGAKSVSLCHD